MAGWLAITATSPRRPAAAEDTLNTHSTGPGPRSEPGVGGRFGPSAGAVGRREAQAPEHRVAILSVLPADQHETIHARVGPLSYFGRVL